MAWKDALYYSRKEVLGLLTLVGLIIISLQLPKLWKLTQKEIDQKRVVVLYESLSHQMDVSDRSVEISNQASPQKAEAQHYTPIKTESKEQKELKNERVEEVQREENPLETEHNPVAKKKISIEVNSATAQQFQQLRGIGPVLSKRIIKYREAIGGFRSIDQIASVYGIEAQVYEAFRPSLTIVPISIPKINVNTASESELAAHVVIHPKLASQIVNYREKIALFSGEEDFKKLYFVDDKIMDNLRPYILYN